MKPPFERFLSETLEQFERHLENERIKPEPRKQRVRGAEQFAEFLLGYPHKKQERTRFKTSNKHTI